MCLFVKRCKNEALFFVRNVFWSVSFLKPLTASADFLPVKFQTKSHPSDPIPNPPHRIPAKNTHVGLPSPIQPIKIPNVGSFSKSHPSDLNQIHSRRNPATSNPNDTSKNPTRSLSAISPDVGFQPTSYPLDATQNPTLRLPMRILDVGFHPSSHPPNSSRNPTRWCPAKNPSIGLHPKTRNPDTPLPGGTRAVGSKPVTPITAWTMVPAFYT